MQSQIDIREFLEEVQGSRDLYQSKAHRERIEHCLRHFSAKGIPLSVCADARHLNRAVSTLQNYARALALRFPDFIPMCTRNAEELAATYRRKKKAA